MGDSQRQVLAANMRRLRARRGWSQEELADRAGIHRTYIGGVERLERNPSLGSIARIAAALGVEVWQLLYPYNPDDPTQPSPQVPSPDDP